MAKPSKATPVRESPAATATQAQPATLVFLGLDVPPEQASDTLVEVRQITPALLARLGRWYGVSEAAIARLAGLTDRTFQRRKANRSALSKTEADATLRIARIAQEATRVFGDPQRAAKWLTTHNVILGEAPIQLLGSDAGTHEVEDELTRIEFGDYA